MLAMEMCILQRNMISLLSLFVSVSSLANKKKFVYAFAGILIGSTSVVYSQTIIKGKVVDNSNKEPVIGATVVVRATTNGVLTDVDGAFALEMKSLPVILSVRYVGYKTQEIAVTDINQSIHVSLEVNPNILDEIVVTGYTSQQRRSVSGAITSVNLTDSYKSVSASGFDQLLQGKVPGCQILSNTGVPGGGVTFRVRGSNSINAGVDPFILWMESLSAMIILSLQAWEGRHSRIPLPT
jgi:hypothetical protein